MTRVILFLRFRCGDDLAVSGKQQSHGLKKSGYFVEAEGVVSYFAVVLYL
jgi:hypothetical protein